METLSPLYLLEKNPQGWKDASLKKLKTSLQSSVGALQGTTPDKLLPSRLALQEQNWREKTGVEARDSHFTIVVPIYNEERFLPSMLGTLAITNIPSSADVNVVFVTNGCTDGGKSESIVDEFMNQQGKIQEGNTTLDTLTTGLSDADVLPIYKYSQVDNNRFIHLTTPTKGKANALTIGNEIALNSQHPVAICLDANTFPEPDAVLQLFKQAYDAIVKNNDYSPVLAGNFTDDTAQEFKSNGMTYRDMLPTLRSYRTKIHGALMAWDTQWVNKIGGIPRVCIEDTALALAAVHDGYEVQHVSDARTWGIAASTLDDRIKLLTRYVRGSLQIKGLLPHLAGVVDHEIDFIKPEAERQIAFTKWAEDDPNKQQLLPWILTLTADIIERGKQEYQERPTDQSWDPVESTK